jgi:hypothetical protein
MSTLQDVIPYQHLNPGSQPSGFLISCLVLMNIYLCSLFAWVLTTKETDITDITK